MPCNRIPIDKYLKLKYLRQECTRNNKNLIYVLS